MIYLIKFVSGRKINKYSNT